MADLNDIKLSAQDILKKQFRSKVKGYDPDEVDSYLDQIISDYETFQDIIEDLYGRIGELQGQVIDAEKQVKQEEEAVKEIPASATTESKEEDVKTYVPSSQRQRADFSLDNSSTSGEISTNMAIIQRLSTLERKVYNLEQRVYGIQDLQK